MTIKKTKYLFLILILTITSCFKRTEIKGTVYSKHNIPVPNATIDLHKYGMSSYPQDTRWGITKTDENGEYYFSFTANKSKRHYYRVHCFLQDSGDALSIIEQGKLNVEDLHLK